MPKKRHHHIQYSKPQSTAPASLASSSASPQSSNHGDRTARSVNQILADLRRVSLRSDQAVEPSYSTAAPGAPSVPPTIRRLLRLPEPPALPPRRPVRVGLNGPRPPPGPAPPRSWLSQSRHAPRQESEGHVSDSLQHHGLPGAYLPGRGSLMDMALRKIAIDWEFQRSYNRYYLYSLPHHLKVALIAYLSLWYENGPAAADLRAILQPCCDDEAEEFEKTDPDPSTVNEDILHLDLTGSLGRSLKLRELSELLFRTPSTTAPAPRKAETALQESWDSPSDELRNAIPRPLLPNLTHLSLSINPRHASNVSWRQLLSFSTHFPTLTHLSLAYWPEPSLTPNAKFASFVVAGGTGSSRTVQYGGTGPYSHSLDDDWSEAVLVLRRLSKSLYGLEWLDLTGCAAWAPTLTATVDHDAVDWAGAWGKITTVLLHPGYSLSGDAGQADRERYTRELALAGRLERHIRSRRAGVGRVIEVETERQADVNYP